MSSSTKSSKIDFMKSIDIILKHSNANDVQNILSRIRSTSKTNYTRDYGDEIKAIVLYYTGFISNKRTILTRKNITDESEINNITYKTIPMNNIIDNIIDNGFVFIINENKKSFINYKNGKFYFNAFKLKDENNFDIDGYYKYNCALYIDDSPDHNVTYEILNSEITRKDIRDLSPDEYIHYQNTNENIKNTFNYIDSDDENKSFIISNINYINNKNVFIELTAIYL